jgi:hypothetical protein
LRCVVSRSAPGSQGEIQQQGSELADHDSAACGLTVFPGRYFRMITDAVLWLQPTALAI